MRLQVVISYRMPEKIVQKVLLNVDENLLECEVYYPVEFLLHCGHIQKECSDPTKTTQLICKRCT